MLRLQRSLDLHSFSKSNVWPHVPEISQILKTLTKTSHIFGHMAQNIMKILLSQLIDSSMYCYSLMIFRMTIQLSPSHHQRVVHIFSSKNDQLPFDFTCISQSVEPAVLGYHSNTITCHNSCHNTEQRAWYPSFFLTNKRWSKKLGRVRCQSQIVNSRNQAFMKTYHFADFFHVCLWLFITLRCFYSTGFLFPLDVEECYGKCFTFLRRPKGL